MSFDLKDNEISRRDGCVIINVDMNQIHSLTKIIDENDPKYKGILFRLKNSYEKVWFYENVKERDDDYNIISRMNNE